MKRLTAFLALAAFLAGCEVAPPGLNSSVQPQVAPGTGVAAPEGAGGLDPALSVYYRQLENDQKVRGLMRTDGEALDAPFNERQLAENFIQIALFDEHPGSRLGAFTRPKPSELRRWVVPVRLALIQGASVPADDRARQQSQTRTYSARLSQVSGHPISIVAPGNENFTLYSVSEAERRALGPNLRRRIPGIGNAAIRTITEMPRSVSCLVIAFSRAGRSNYTDAIAIIRAEHPPASWRSCLHEEVAQGLGLPNDHPRARPSIFNDDEEFALLTGHDELLLSILYDPRLSPGMSAETATPIVRQIAAEKLGLGGPV
ncbi:MAG: DUF2927 domain-containing protein [Rhodobacteraceae bacterium]|nr:DUF2927 domain-containing protein [Paracoccaceae bacterium]